MTLAAAAGLALLATAGHDILPAIMSGNNTTPALLLVVSIVWALTLLALLFLSRRRPYSVLDLWLMVMMVRLALRHCLERGPQWRPASIWASTGRIYGLLATNFVLTVLLLENSRLYLRLIEAHASERTQNPPSSSGSPRWTSSPGSPTAAPSTWRSTRVAARLAAQDAALPADDGRGLFQALQRPTATSAATNACSWWRRRWPRNCQSAPAKWRRRYGGENSRCCCRKPSSPRSAPARAADVPGGARLNIPHAGSAAAPHVTISVRVASALHALVSDSRGHRWPWGWRPAHSRPTCWSNRRTRRSMPPRRRAATGRCRRTPTDVGRYSIRFT